ncbi:MAG: MFS transporter [Myxococcales bacterium]|nr:MFS transporter [Myxococcales bacterium]
MAQRGPAIALDMDRYQWTVLFAAWLGWGFDVFDGLLFNFVAPSCVPTLLGLPLGTPEARSATLFWTGTLSAVLLIGWAVGGILFGRVADQLGRTRTLLITMALYSLGTAACSLAPNIWVLLVFRIIASLGIGGEWAAGAAMVAEVVPENRRVEAGALLYTSAPLGLFLATQVTWLVQGVVLPGDPGTSWRIVFLSGLIPAAVALAVRWFVEEPERWASTKEQAPPRLAELFTGTMRARTLSGLAMAITALVMWWSCNAFIPVVASGLAEVEAGVRGLDPAATTALKQGWKALATNVFNVGGLAGTLLTVPIAKHLGRRAMFGLYFVASAVSIAAAFGLDLPAEWRLWMYLPIGLSVFGVFGSFTYYLPELFPTRLRGTGAGFCYNAGRVLAAAGPFLVGGVASRGADALTAAMSVLVWVAAVPVLGALLLPWVTETRDMALED